MAEALGPEQIAMWLVWFLGGSIVTVVGFYLKKRIARATTAWLLTIAVGALGVILLLVGGYLEYQSPAPGGVIFVAVGAALLAASGVGATVAAKWEAEDRRGG